MAIGTAQPHSKSYSFPVFHADEIPYSATPRRCPDMPCEQICFRNDPASIGNVYLGTEGHMTNTRSMILEPGDWSPWIPIQNLNLVSHFESAASTRLRYMIIR